MGRTALSDDVKKKVISLSARGVSMSKIASQTSISQASVHRILTENKSTSSTGKTEMTSSTTRSTTSTTTSFTPSTTKVSVSYTELSSRRDELMDEVDTLERMMSYLFTQTDTDEETDSDEEAA